MRAIVQKQYGGVDVLELADVEVPTPETDEVLVKVRVAGVNDWDLGLLLGSPFFMRFFIGWFRPKISIIGCEMAGEVEAVGDEVTRFKPGNKVYCDLSYGRFGAYAEYVCVKESEAGAYAH